jgi:hypothetical protein
MKKVIYLLAMIVCVCISAQTVEGTPEFKTGRAAGNASEGKLKKAPKRFFINTFTVNYQILYNDWEATREGVNIGATSASLTVGFEGMEEKDFQELTDNLYNAYLSKMKSEGFEIVNIGELQGMKQVEKYSLVSGAANYKEKRGYIATSPSELSYYQDAKGKNLLIARLTKLDAIAADVVINVPFMRDSESGASKLAGKAVGGISKVVASPSLQIDESSKVSYTWPANLSVLITPMKESLTIKGVFDESEKFRAESLSRTNTEYQIGHLTRVYSEDVNTSNIQVAKADPEKYKAGVSKGLQLFLNGSAEMLLSTVSGK